jgi:hypothetical protein
MLVGVQSEIRNRHLPNTDQKCNSVVQPARVNRNSLSSCGNKRTHGKEIFSGVPKLYLLCASQAQMKGVKYRKTFCGRRLRWLLSAFMGVLSQEESGCRLFSFRLKSRYCRSSRMCTTVTHTYRIQCDQSKYPLRSGLLIVAAMPASL